WHARARRLALPRPASLPCVGPGTNREQLGTASLQALDASRRRSTVRFALRRRISCDVDAADGDDVFDRRAPDDDGLHRAVFPCELRKRLLLGFSAAPGHARMGVACILLAGNQD